MATISKKSETLDWSVIQKVDVASLYEVTCWAVSLFQVRLRTPKKAKPRSSIII